MSQVALTVYLRVMRIQSPDNSCPDKQVGCGGDRYVQVSSNRFLIRFEAGDAITNEPQYTNKGGGSPMQQDGNPAERISLVEKSLVNGYCL